MAEIIRSGKTIYLHIDGYLYYKHSVGNGVVYWRCKEKPCPARVTTGPVTDANTVAIRKGGPAVSPHDSHAPNREKVDAVKILTGIKRRAAEHPEAPPIQIMRLLQDVPSAVMAELPDRENIKKQIQRERLKELPANPLSIKDLQEVPEKFTQTANGERFLFYDSLGDENFNKTAGRILVFTTRDNLKNLSKSKMWFVDGTFKTAPGIFFQLFAILGSVTQLDRGVEQTLALPFVYALMESKCQDAYSKVFDIVLNELKNSGITNLPEFVMSDFELAIINAATNYFGAVHGCFFHLCQSVYRRIQAEGLQGVYNDEDDRSFKTASQMLCALAFVPVEQVPDYFDLLLDNMPDSFSPIADYFELNYVRGKPARGRRKAVFPRYDPQIWNQYDAVRYTLARTNNFSEGWHNRFQIVVGKHHPSLYNFLTELKKEQADTEAMLQALSLGQKIKKKKAPVQVKMEERLRNIILTYESEASEEDMLKYLRSVGYTLHF